MPRWCRQVAGIQATSSFTISVPRDALAPLSQPQVEALSFELSHIKYFSQAFPSLPRIRLNSRARYPLDPGLASKVAKRLQNQTARIDLQGVSGHVY